MSVMPRLKKAHLLELSHIRRIHNMYLMAFAVSDQSDFVLAFKLIYALDRDILGIMEREAILNTKPLMLKFIGLNSVYV